MNPDASDPRTGQSSPLRQLPRSIWALGFVSLCMDMSSELIHSLLPLFLVGTLGIGAAALGLIEGLAEAIASVLKVVSGVWSDRIRRRKWLTLAGYGLAALTKPLFPMAESVQAVMVARFADRTGKGIRGAPRDALIADLSPPHLHGAAFGLRQSLDTFGAVLGPLIAIAALLLLDNDIRAVLWIGVVPALVAVAVLAFAVREPPRAADPAPRPKFNRAALRKLGSRFWTVIGIGSAMTLARFSEAFLILRGESCGLSLTQAPLVLVVMSLVYALSAYPAGALSDRVGRHSLLLIGLLVLVLADLVLAWAAGPVLLLAGAALWGLHMGLTQGLLAALVADAADPLHRGTAFGVFHLLTGFALFAASLLAGGLWQYVGPSATFYTGAGVTLCAAAGFAVYLRGSRKGAHS